MSKITKSFDGIFHISIAFLYVGNILKRIFFVQHFYVIAFIREAHQIFKKNPINIIFNNDVLMENKAFVNEFI